MQKKAIYMILFLVAMLALSSLACSLTGGDEETADVPTPAATAEMPETAVDEPSDSTAPEEAEEASSETAEQPQPTAEPAPSEEPTEEPAPAFEGIAMDTVLQNPEFESYEFNMTMTITPNDPSSGNEAQTLDFTIQHTANPRATSMSMSGMGLEGMEEGFENITIVQIEGTAYMVMPEIGCMTFPANEDEIFAENPMNDLFNDGTFDDLDHANYEGRETINGIETYHYSFDETSMPDAGEAEWIDGHIYLAVDGGYLVRMTMQGEGMMDMAAEGEDSGEMYLEMNLTSVNQPITIPLPADCETMEGGSEYPVIEGAYELSSFPGLVSYKTESTAEEVVAFYEEALAAEGWEYIADESFTGGGSSLLSYRQDGKSLTLTVGPDTDNPGVTFVALIGE